MECRHPEWSILKVGIICSSFTQPPPQSHLRCWKTSSSHPKTAPQTPGILVQEDKSVEGVLLVGKAEFGSIDLDLVWMETHEGLGNYKKTMDNGSQRSPGLMDFLGDLQFRKFLIN